MTRTTEYTAEGISKAWAANMSEQDALRAQIANGTESRLHLRKLNLKLDALRKEACGLHALERNLKPL